MAAAKKTSNKSPSKEEIWDHATDLLGKIWDYWRMDLGHSENDASKKMKLLMKTLHQEETKVKKKVVTKAKKIIKKAKAAPKKKKK